MVMYEENENEMTIQEILQACTIEDKIIKLPAGQLERGSYLEVKKSLELIGGKWKGGKTQGFVFEEDPAELLVQLASGEQRNLKKEFQFFATPEPVAKMMMEYLPFIHANSKILEPSAGDGALIKALCEYDAGYKKKIDCFETMDLNRTKLSKMPRANVIGNNFLECDLDNTYDFVIANPPFTNNQDIDHIYKMYDVCKPGGMIITMASCSWVNPSSKKQIEFKVWLDVMNAAEEELPEGTFKESGTNVKTMLLRIVKPAITEERVLVSIPKNKVDRKAAPPAVLNAPAEDISDKEKDIANVRTCRVCGCTDNDCRQCIKKTGKPCTWIEQDLCSACGDAIKTVAGKPKYYATKLTSENLRVICNYRKYPIYDAGPSDSETGKNILVICSRDKEQLHCIYFDPLSETGEEEAIQEAQKWVEKYIFEKQNQSSTKTDNIMNFFSQLSALGKVDMSMRILQDKTGNLTLMVMPGTSSSTVKPFNITGTPAELDEGFFTQVMPGVKEIAGLISNINDVKQDLIENPEPKDKVPHSATTKANLKKNKASKKPAVGKSKLADKNGKVKPEKKAPVTKEIVKKVAAPKKVTEEKAAEPDLFPAQ